MAALNDPALPARFWTKVNDLDGCWLWTAQIDRHGYARLSWRGQAKNAHRVAYEELVGRVPAGLQLDHLCRVRHCVNPAHLEPVTSGENTRRGEGNGSQTHCPADHPYDEDNTYSDPRGARRCRACNRAAAAAYRENRKAS